MSYIDGFVIPVPLEKKQAYIEMARKAQAIYLEYGAIRVVESWGDDLQKGKINDFRTAVIAEDNEGVIFSWIEWPDKATRDAGNQKIMADHRMQMSDEMPFSGGWALSGLAIAFLTFDGVLKFFLDKMPPEAMADSAKLAYPMNIMNPWPSHILIPVYLGVFIWLGLYLRMPALRAFVPLRKT